MDAVGAIRLQSDRRNARIETRKGRNVVPREGSADMSSDQANPNRRRHMRKEVSIPCTISWGQRESPAEISDLSLDGAMIRGARELPSPGASVAVRFRFRDEGIHLLGRVTSEVIHARDEGRGETWAFGVRFETSMESLLKRVVPTFEQLLEDE